MNTRAKRIFPALLVVLDQLCFTALKLLIPDLMAVVSNLIHQLLYCCRYLDKTTRRQIPRLLNHDLLIFARSVSVERMSALPSLVK
jgi:hypothetical protein